MRLDDYERLAKKICLAKKHCNTIMGGGGDLMTIRKVKNIPDSKRSNSN